MELELRSGAAGRDGCVTAVSLFGFGLIVISEIEITMAQSEMESFINKFKALSHAGKNANLSLKSEAGKVIVSLSVEIEQVETSRHYRPARNGPSRQRRRERRELARAEASAAAEDAATEATLEDTEARNAAAQTNSEEALAKTAPEFVEPRDEIENEIIRSENQQTGELCSTISVIPIRHVNPTDDDIRQSIRKKLQAKKVKVLDIFIQRSNQGTFMWSDVNIEALDGGALEKIDFEFAKCRVLPFYGQRKT